MLALKVLKGFGYASQGSARNSKQSTTLPINDDFFAGRQWCLKVCTHMPSSTLPATRSAKVSWKKKPTPQGPGKNGKTEKPKKRTAEGTSDDQEAGDSEPFLGLTMYTYIESISCFPVSI